MGSHPSASGLRADSYRLTGPVIFRIGSLGTGLMTRTPGLTLRFRWAPLRPCSKHLALLPNRTRQRRDRCDRQPRPSLSAIAADPRSRTSGDSPIRPTTGLHSCTWPKPSLHSSLAFAVPPKHLVLLAAFQLLFSSTYLPRRLPLGHFRIKRSILRRCDARWPWPSIRAIRYRKNHERRHRESSSLSSAWSRHSASSAPCWLRPGRNP